jgi:hypothetical protein
VTLNDLQRAALVLFAVREAGAGASVEQMKAICYCMRNRVKAGWHPDWLTAMEHAQETAGNLPGAPATIDVNDRAFQVLLHDIDDIYFSTAGNSKPMMEEGPGEQSGETMEEALKECKYWQFLGPGRPVNPWFTENIAGDHENHPCRAQMGLMMFFE